MKKFNLIVTVMFLALGSQAQSIKSYVITNAGASIMGEGGGMYLSIGEPMSTEIAEGDIMISQGFLQVTVIGNSVSAEDLLQEPIYAYPNPTADKLTLEIPEMDGAYQYQMFDLMGQLIQTNTIESKKEIVNLSSLAEGTYLLKVIKEGKQSSTLKIVKL